MKLGVILRAAEVIRLRDWYYRFRFPACKFYEGCALAGLKNISFGRGVIACDLRLSAGGRFSAGPFSCFNRGTCIEVDPRTTVSVGARASLGPGVRVYTWDHPLDLESTTYHGGIISPKEYYEHCKHGSVAIGEDAWIGCNAIILKGVSIGRGAVVGAGSVVTKNIPDYEIWAGNPARRIGKRLIKKKR